ncbi:hypothetical protein NQ317_017307 [Molorchus minor]|uniref:Uncharacterized protein n=1 Tax=Molorchus minor TaxID=1323400 RepID=A0ABQ9ISR8_9CUCU|nr:hypothetical protein NQ317_017307 [Molorchus minor]
MFIGLTPRRIFVIPQCRGPGLTSDCSPAQILSWILENYPYLIA